MIKRLSAFLFARLFVPIAWTVTIQVLLCIPGKDLPDTETFYIPDFDKLVHLVLFGGFVFLWSYYCYLKKFPASKLKVLFFVFFLVASFNGILMEFVQLYYIPGRSFDTGDMLLDVLGAGIAYGICNIKLLKTSNQA